MMQNMERLLVFRTENQVMTGVVWPADSGSGIGRMNKVTLHRAQIVPRRVTICRCIPKLNVLFTAPM